MTIFKMKDKQPLTLNGGAVCVICSIAQDKLKAEAAN